jgi:AcrR family transcriptional regulator
MEHAKRKIGRPLSFDRPAALRAAMLAFWRHGYETTSIVDLTTAMGITAPSLYTAFGDKLRLFLEAVELYAGDPAERGKAITEASSAYRAASDLLDAVAAAYTGEETPAGCLLASATATGSPASFDVQRVIAEIRKGLTAQLASRIDRDVNNGLMPATCNPKALADLVVAVIQGMSVLARDGGSRDQLLAVARSAMAAWPSPICIAEIDAGIVSKSAGR